MRVLPWRSHGPQVWAGAFVVLVVVFVGSCVDLALDDTLPRIYWLYTWGGGLLSHIY